MCILSIIFGHNTICVIIHVNTDDRDFKSIANIFYWRNNQDVESTLYLNVQYDDWYYFELDQFYRFFYVWFSFKQRISFFTPEITEKFFIYSEYDHRNCFRQTVFLETFGKCSLIHWIKSIQKYILSLKLWFYKGFFLTF